MSSEVYHCAIIHGKINLMNVNPTFIKMIYLKLLCACAAGCKYVAVSICGHIIGPQNN